MDKILWACIVYEKDMKWLSSYCQAILDQKQSATHVLIVDSSNSGEIKKAIPNNTTPPFEYKLLPENLGFNQGLNVAIDNAINGSYEWLATMTVRATASKTWLDEAIKAGQQDNGIGMVSTVHLDPCGKVDCAGHNLGQAGELFQFGEGLGQPKLDELLSQFQDQSITIWGPCCGGALYRVSALREARDLIGEKDLVRPRGFKSYNCDAIAFLIRASGYKHTLARKAYCKRDRKGSTSKNPRTAGLLMNQEINRIANLFDFWEPKERDAALKKYLTKPRANKILDIGDIVIARTIGEGMSRQALFADVRCRVKDELKRHLEIYPEVKCMWKCLRLAKCWRALARA